MQHQGPFFCEGIPLLLTHSHHFLWEVFETKARSPEKFMNVSDVKMIDEDSFLSRSMMIK